MLFAIVKPVLMSGAELEYPDFLKIDLNDSQTVLLVSNTPGKKFSTAIKINTSKINNSIKDPVIRIDKSNVGPLLQGDKVLLRPFNPPVAKQVLLVLDSKLDAKIPLAEGNWGNEIVNPAVLGQIINVGQSIDFIYGSKNPVFLTGLIRASIPKAPALVDNQTNFFIEKLSETDLTKIKIESENRNEERAEELVKLIEEEKFEAIASIRNETFDKLDKTFSFSQVEPESIYKILRNWLEGSSHSFYLDNFDKIKDNSVGTIIAFPKTKSDTKIDYLIEINLSATLKQGSCLISGRSADLHKVETLMSELIKQLRKSTTSLKEIPQAIPDVCAGCGARLNLTKQNAKGVVNCDKCTSPNLLPFALRL